MGTGYLIHFRDGIHYLQATPPPGGIYNSIWFLIPSTVCTASVVILPKTTDTLQLTDYIIISIALKYQVDGDL